MTTQKAVVLAAGLGTRLRPLTCVTPKPLMPIWGERMLARIVALLRARGVTEIVVNGHYLAPQIQVWCEANGCQFSHEPEILGTGGVLNPLRAWIGNDDFYLVNGDIILENVPDLTLPEGCLGAALMTETTGPRTVEVEPESGFATCWKSPDPGWSSTYTYCGFALLKAKVLDYVEPAGFSSIVQAYERAMMDGLFVKCVTAPDLLWADAGTIQSYIELNTDGNENAFADFPQLKAVGFTDPIECLGARGSDRVFFRSGNQIAVIYDDTKRGENAKYAGHARWLKAHGISVPDVLQDLPDQKITVFSFVGIPNLKGFENYIPVIQELAKFNALDASELALEPAFDANLWQWERDLFVTHCLKGRFGKELSADVAAELKQVEAVLEKEPKALVHRDFQSTNILWKNGKLSIIDFQGMREGPAVYDLASLLYDPYVSLSEKERTALAALYGQTCGRMAITQAVPFAAVQRLIQALGAYGRLSSVGQKDFEKFILPALQNLLVAADEANLDAVGALAEELIHLEQHHQEGHHHA